MLPLVLMTLSQAPDLTARQTHLLLEMDDLSLRANAVDLSWPTSARVLTLAGASFGPSFTLIGALMLGVGLALIPALIVPGAVLLGCGVTGLTLLSVGLSRGSAAEREARADRERLLDLRAQRQRELFGG
jgi:hypothetical protein